MLLLIAVLLVGVVSGATATVSGFGIGSMLTPLLATRYTMPIAVAAVSVPHAIATALRCWRLRANIAWPVIRSFGVLSAIGGLTGALLYTRFSSRALTVILGVLLVATSIGALTDWLRKLEPHGFVAQTLGFVSGLFGGVAGNQGGLRAGALLAFSLAPAAFVATATATGLAVDAARMPIYVWRAGGTLVSLATPITVACLGVLIGTLLGERLLFGLSPERFRRVVGMLVGLLGVWLLAACTRAETTNAYRPQVRNVTITTVPLLVREEQAVLRFLKQDFAPGGVLDGKEVYGFSPSTVTVVEGDTIRFTLINPEDDDHTFVLPDLAVALPPQKSVTATYVAKRTGIYPIECTIPKHVPMMSGQLVVLSPRALQP